jgi:hypothetical protein
LAAKLREHGCLVHCFSVRVPTDQHDSLLRRLDRRGSTGPRLCCARPVPVRSVI